MSTGGYGPRAPEGTAMKYLIVTALIFVALLGASLAAKVAVANYLSALGI